MKHGRWQHSQPLSFNSILPPSRKHPPTADTSDEAATTRLEQPMFFGAIRTIIFGWLIVGLAVAGYLTYLE